MTDAPWETVKQDWVLKKRDDSWVATFTDMSYWELQDYARKTWPEDFEADQIIASSLTNHWSTR